MGKHNHTYNGCTHSLEFCAHCDTVYCTKCQKEWYTQKPYDYFIGNVDVDKKRLPYELPYKPVYMAANNSMKENHSHAES
jgi:hypothetical protein